MTNVAGPVGTPPRGGMPKWLIILLVVLIVVLLGCCGGITACFVLGRRVVKAGASAAQSYEKDMQRRAAEADRPGADATPTDIAGAAPAGDNAAPAADGAAGAAPDTAGAAPSARAQKLPATFPGDVPIEPGMTPTFSMGDNTKGSGSVILSGNVKTDDAVAYYTKELEKAGWTQTGNSAVNTMTQMQYKKDPLTMIVQVSGGEGKEGTTVMIIYEKQQ